MPEYITQKAVEPKKVVKGRRLSLEEYGAQFIVQPKYDGCCVILHQGQAFSRTGEPNVACSHHAWEAFTRFPERTFIGEAWHPEKDFSEISGEFRRQQQSGWLRVVVFDSVTGQEFIDGHSPRPYVERWANAQPLGVVGPEHLFENVPRLNYHYQHPDVTLRSVMSVSGYDGIILRDPKGTWTAGRGTSGEIIKLKQKLSFDLRVLEVNTEIGEKTGREVYKLVVDFRGRRLGVGSGLPHTRSACPNVGDIVEVEAMALSSDGLLREPRFKGIRHDKLETD